MIFLIKYKIIIDPFNYAKNIFFPLNIFHFLTKKIHFLPLNSEKKSFLSPKILYGVKA